MQPIKYKTDKSFLGVSFEVSHASMYKMAKKIIIGHFL